MLSPNLASRAENAVKFQLKLSHQIKKKTKQIQIRNGVGDEINMT